MRTAILGVAILVSAFSGSAGAMPVGHLKVSAADALMPVIACTRDGFRGVRVYRNCVKPSASTDPRARWKENAARRKAHRTAAAAQ